jgi:deazaflavin-dependent oxidoreductase (nitroreductase family)
LVTAGTDGSTASAVAEDGVMNERSRLWQMRHIATHYLDPLLRPLAGWAPWFGILTHRGRRSGRTYRTPLNVFRRGDLYVFFLTYGSDVDWVKNVLAAGRATLRTRGSDVELAEPELVTDPERRLVPPPVRVAGRLLDATQFLLLRRAR